MKIAVYDPFRNSIFSKGICYIKDQGHEVCGFSKHLRTSDSNDFLNLCNKRFSRIKSSGEFYEKLIDYSPDIFICTNILDANFGAEANSYLRIPYGISKNDLDNFYLEYKPNTSESLVGYFEYPAFSSSSIFWLSKDYLVPTKEKSKLLHSYSADFSDRYSVAVNNGECLFYYYNKQGDKDIYLSNYENNHIQLLVKDFHQKYFSKSKNYIYYNLLIIKHYSEIYQIAKISFDFFSNFSFMITLPYIGITLFDEKEPKPFNFNIKELEPVTISSRESSLVGDLNINEY